MSKELDRYPRIQLNGQGPEYVLKYGLVAMKRLKEWGVDITKSPADNIEGWFHLSSQVAASCCVAGEDGKVRSADLKQSDVEAAYDGNPDLPDMVYLRSAMNRCADFRLAPAGEGSPSGNTPAPVAT